MASNFTSGLEEGETEYNSTLGWLYSQLPMFSRTGAAAYKPGLQTSEELDRLYGHPHRSYRTVHIAGTNGKGSVSSMLASILQESGYRTGLYTSPHLVDFRERIRVNGEMISRQGVIDFTRGWKEKDTELRPSFFELTMMMAFDWFRREQVDVAVIEVGMGGRLDSTNIITPEGCVITNISKDHTQFLGTTLEAIAGEKAGIIKPGIPVVVGEAEGEVREVFLRKGEETGAPVTLAEETRPLLETEETDTGWKCRGRGAGDFNSPLGGDCQKKNINTVLEAVEMLRRRGFDIPDRAVRDGMAKVVANTGLTGRWTVLKERPLTICDTGHNTGGLGINLEQLQRIRRRRGGRLRMVIGFVADKAIDEILAMMPRNADYYFTQASIPRALDSTALQEKAEAGGLRGRRFTDVKEAVRKATEEASDEDIVYVGGSTFVVADYLA